jgi:tetratricopeptide (TPR) repeat protein
MEWRLSMRLDATAETLAEKLLFAPQDEKKRRNNIIVVGAGASVTAGIPTVPNIAKKLLKIISNRIGITIDNNSSDSDVYKTLEASGRISVSRKDESKALSDVSEGDIDWWHVYDDCFRRYMTQPNDVRKLFSDLVDEAGGAINWSHLALGELVSRGIFNTVLTTNFDQLALAGIVRAGTIPVVCDGLESLNRIDGAPSHPQLIEIHGSRHTYFLRNDRLDVAAVQNDPAAIAAIQNLFNRAHCVVVVGYGGREDGLMDLLIKSSEIYRDKNIFWVMHDHDANNLSIKAKTFLSNSRNSFIITGQDSDEFFLNLSKYLRIGSPTVISSPIGVVSNWIREAQLAAIANADIKAELDLAAFKLKNLRESDDQIGLDPVTSVVASIRAKRIAGDLPGSFEILENEIEKYHGLSATPIPLLQEAATLSIEYAPMAADVRPAELAAEISIYLAHIAPDASERMQWYGVLGRAITVIGNLDTKHASIEQSVPVLREGLEMIERSEYPEHWARIKANLGNALSRLSQSNPSLEAEVLEIYDDVVDFSERNNLQEIASMVRNGNANLLLRHGVSKKNLATLDEAIELYKLSLSGIQSDEHNRQRGMTTGNLSSALFKRYILTKDNDDLESSLIVARDSVEFYNKSGSSYGIKKSSDLLRSIEKEKERESAKLKKSRKSNDK